MRLQHFALYPPKSFIHKLPIKNDIHKHNNINHTDQKSYCKAYARIFTDTLIY